MCFQTLPYGCSIWEVTSEFSFMFLLYSENSLVGHIIKMRIVHSIHDQIKYVELLKCCNKLIHVHFLDSTK
jgi:hypothetical protein